MIACAKPKHMPENNNFDFDQWWKKVDSLEAKALPRSALEEVEKLYEKSKIKHADAHSIKAILYKNKYIMQLEEEAAANALLRFEKESEIEESPVKEVLHSILGELYLWYGQNNAYTLQNRTETQFFNPEDLKTWSLERLLSKSSEHYLQSVENEDLAKYGIAYLKPILTRYDDEATHYIGNVQEFLLIRAIQHFQKSVSLVTEPVYKFRLDQVEAFGSVNIFTTYKFTTKDKESQIYRATQLYQRALAHYQMSENFPGLLHVNIKRLGFANQHSSHPEKKKLYVASLERLIQNYPDQKEITEAYHLLANHWYTIGSKKNSKEELVKAAELCKEATSKHPKSYGASLCNSILSNLENRSIALQTEEVQSPDLPIRILVKYKNLAKVHLKIIELSSDEMRDIERLRNKDRLKRLNSFNAIRSWSQNLPSDLDYRHKSTEILTDKLDSGSYVILISDSDKFTDNAHAVAYAFYHVSRLSYSFLNEFNKASVLVTDNYSGKPIQGAKVEFYESYYDSSDRNNRFRLVDTKKSDENGYVSSNKLSEKSLTLRIEYEGDQLDLRWNHYANKLYESRANEVVHFFTDRAIYRPGQIVYFKGLLLNYKQDEFPSLVPNKKVNVRLLDANYQEKQKETFVTNEYGSFHGSFIAPSDGLTGRMTLQANNRGTHIIRVEEYKRPKFEVKLDSIDASYVLGDSVTITGIAKTYAGSPIDNSDIRFSIKRRSILRWAWRGYHSNQAEMQLAYGNSLTDKSGRFTLKFIAQGEPGESNIISYLFNVNVDVTDEAGETRSATKSYNIGHKAFKFEVNLNGELDKSSLDTIRISALNYNQEKTKTTGSFQVIQLEEPSLVQRNRYWNRPDTIVSSKREWNSYFPFEGFDDQDVLQKRKELQVIQDGVFETSNLSGFQTKANIPAGSYKLKIKASNENGEELEEEFYFTVFDYARGDFPKTKELFIKQNQTIFQPGDVLTIKLGSPSDHLAIWYMLEKDGNIKEAKWLNASPTSEISVPVQEADRGGFIVHLNWIKNNRYHSEILKIDVPWSNKELQFELMSFRDKLIPGSNEEWSLKIKGSKGEQVAAEILATMYDASLDAFVSPYWKRSFTNNYRTKYHRQSAGFRAVSSRILSKNWNSYSPGGNAIQLPSLNFFNLYQYFISRHHPPVMMRETSMMQGKRADVDEVRISNDESAAGAAEMMDNAEPEFNEESVSGPPAPVETSFSPRVNLNETVFFYPALKTDKDGNVLISFTMNEALTRWKFLSFGHTKDFQHAFEEKEVVTQKDLMVFPNAPRFLRQGDELEMAAKLVNMSNKELSVRVYLDLENALSGKQLDTKYNLQNKTQLINIEAGQSKAIRWKITVPETAYLPLKYRIMATTGDFTDGEEDVIPVVSNRMLVTESLPLALKGNETKKFEFISMKNSFESESMVPHAYTLEYTSNPIWFAIQALPYIMEFPHECSEQLLNRYYANAIASHIVEQNPKIKAVFEQWKTTDKDALLSNLSKNQELKSALLEETPWVLNALSEEEQKRNIALLFDLNTMRQSQNSAISKLSERQLSNGGFPWFTGGRDNPYISQYMLEGIGHLHKLGIIDINAQPKIKAIIEKLIRYVDDRISEKYQKLLDHIEYTGGDINMDHLDAFAIHYLYARSFFQEKDLPAKAREAHTYYFGQTEKYWVGKGIYLEAMGALAIKRNGKSQVYQDILKSLMERAIIHDELGMYWKQNTGYNWYQLPVERQALMIEAGIELGAKQEEVDNMKTWMLKMKQTTHWKTSKSTAAAIYALLLDQSANSDLTAFDNNSPVIIKLGDQEFNVDDLSKQAGTGYVKRKFEATEVESIMAQIEVENTNDHINWGAVYWQYFEDLDKIKTFEETPLTLKKQIFKIVIGDKGDRLVPITQGTGVQVGDKLKIRIELRVDRPMEYVHMKDMRASGLEPLNVLSSYKWQGGLGYYESTRDLASHFFIDYLPVGTFVFEYPLSVFHKGNFSNGITTIQSMYAPEFSSHSEGIRVEIK
jgi:hypothetical protein